MTNVHIGFGEDPVLPAIGNVAATMNGHVELLAGTVSIEAPEPELELDYGQRTNQRRFLETAMTQAREVEYNQRTIRGPHHAVFNSYVGQIQTALRAIDPAFTPDYLAPPGYRTQEVYEYMGKHARHAKKLDDLRLERIFGLREIGMELTNQISTQELPDGLLDVPRYHYQGEHEERERRRQLCVNACFRMVHDGIAGWAPDEDVLGDMMTDEHGGVVLEDEEYFKLLQTPAFKELSGRTVKVVEMLGADFQTITKLTDGVKTKYPDAKVYAVASLGSATAHNKDTWHSLILSKADKDGVVARDPALQGGSSHKLMYTNQFLKRWAIAYNRVQMIIAI
jgi:hypothetical protein